MDILSGNRVPEGAVSGRTNRVIGLEVVPLAGRRLYAINDLEQFFTAEHPFLAHRVTPVTQGERLAAVTWVQSKVRDPCRREILADLDRVRRRMSALDPDGAETDIAFKSYANLLRRWADL